MTKYAIRRHHPIGGISKTDLKSFLNMQQRRWTCLPWWGFSRRPHHAELEPLKDGRLAQTDEQDIGMTYAELSRYGRLCKPPAPMVPTLCSWSWPTSGEPEEPGPGGGGEKGKFSQCTPSTGTRWPRWPQLPRRSIHQTITGLTSTLSKLQRPLDLAVLAIDEAVQRSTRSASSPRTTPPKLNKQSLD